MPAIYPENKSYGTADAKIASLNSFQNSIKQIKSNMQSQAATKQKAAPAPAPYAGGYAANPATAQDSISALISRRLPTEKIIQPESSRSQVEATYPSSTPLESPHGAKTTIKTLPPSLGGSQYTSDPDQPGKSIKWFTGERKYNDPENELIKAGYDPSFYEIDHEMPLALGGADTIGNKVILAKPDHDVKSRIQQVAIQLKQNGKISDREAQGMAANWQSYKPYLDQIPSLYDDSGTYRGITTEQAQKVYNDFKKAPNVTWKSFKEAIPDAPKAIKNPFAREFFKGAATQVPFLDLALPEVAKYNEVDKYGSKEDARAAKFGHFAGMVFGGVAAFGLVGKALGIAGKGLSLAGRATGIINETKQAAQVLEGIKAGKTLTSVTEGANIKTLEEANKLKGLMGKGSPIAKLATSDMMKQKLKEGGVNALLGQTYNQGDASMSERMAKAAGDFAMGTFIGGDPTKVKSYVNTMGGSTIISIMMGQDIEDALANGATMTALHGISGIAPLMKIGSKAGVNAEFGSPHVNLARRIAEKTGNLPAGQMSFKEKYSPKRLNKEGVVELQAKLNQENIEQNLNKTQIKLATEIRKDIYGEGYNAKKTGSDPALLDQENKIIFDKLADKAHAEGWSLEKIQDEMKKVMMSGRVLYKQGLTPENRLKADIEDLWTIRKKIVEGKITQDNKPADVNIANEMVNKNPELVSRNAKITLEEVTPNRETDIIIPIGGTGDNVKGGNQLGKGSVPENIKAIKDMYAFAEGHPEHTSTRVLSPEDISAAGLTKYSGPDYKGLATDVYVFPENGMHTKAQRALDNLIEKKKASGAKLSPYELSHVNSAHPDVAQGVYVKREWVDKGVKKSEFVRVGSVARKSNYHKADTVFEGDKEVPEFNLEAHNKDTMNDIIQENNLKAVIGKAVFVMNTKSGNPFGRIIIKPGDINVSKGFSGELDSHGVNKAKVVAKEAIGERPVEKAPIEATVPAVVEPKKAAMPPDFLKSEAPVAEKVKATPHPKEKQIVSGISELGSKSKRAVSLAKELELGGMDKIDSIKEGESKTKFIEEANRIINNVGLSQADVNKGMKNPRLQISAAENKRINEMVQQKLRASLNEVANTKFPPENAVSFRGDNPKDPDLIKAELLDTEKKIGLKSGDDIESTLPADIKEQLTRESALEETVKGAKEGEGTLDRMKRLQKETVESPFAKIFAKTGKGVATKGGVNITAGDELKKGIDKIIAKPENTAKFGFNKALDEGMAILFPNKYGNYSSNFTLNSLLQDQVGKGKLFKENYYKATNEQGHYFSQPKDVITAGNISNEALSAARDARRAALQVKGDTKTQYHEGLAIVDPLQGEDTMAKDLVAGELRNYGLLSADAGAKQDAMAGANAALGLLDEWANIIKKPGEKRKFVDYDKIREKIREAIGAGSKADVNDYMAQRLKEETEAARGAIANRPK